MEPGWYRNPKDPDIIRYWDGVQWSEAKHAPQTTRRDSLPDGFQATRSGVMRVLAGLLVVACVIAAALTASALLGSKDSKRSESNPGLPSPREFESTSITVFGPRGKVDTTKLVGMPAAFILNNNQDISLGVGQNIINKPSPDGSGYVSKGYWTNIFLSPETSDVFLEALNKRISGTGYGDVIPESSESTLVYLGEELSGTSLRFAVKDSPVTTLLEISYYEIGGDDTLVVTRSFPGDEFVDSSKVDRGSVGSWAEDLAKETGWFLSGAALQPRMDSVEFSGSTHTATATFKVPAAEYENVMQGIKDGSSLAGFANIAPKQAFQESRNRATVFFRAGTRIEVSITRPELNDTESTVIVSFDVKAP